MWCLIEWSLKSWLIPLITDNIPTCFSQSSYSWSKSEEEEKHLMIKIWVHMTHGKSETRVSTNERADWVGKGDNDSEQERLEDRQTLQILLTGWHRQPDKHNQDNFPKSAAHTSQSQLYIQVLHDFIASAVYCFIVFLLHTFTLTLITSFSVSSWRFHGYQDANEFSEQPAAWCLCFCHACDMCLQ